MKFPMKVRCGRSSVTIYRQGTKRGYVSYLVRFYRGTEEIQITRSRFEEAHKEAKAAARALSHGEVDVLVLRSDDRLSYVRAVNALAGTFTTGAGAGGLAGGTAAAVDLVEGVNTDFLTADKR